MTAPDHVIKPPKTSCAAGGIHTWHYSPKHGSWLNMAESELGVLSNQCLDRRIPDRKSLSNEIAAWQKDRILPLSPKKGPLLKIIFLNRYFYPDHSATSQMLSDLAFRLAANGHSVHVITSQLLYEGADILPCSEVIEGVTVRRVRTTAFGRVNLFGRSVDYLTFFLSSALLLIFETRRGDVIVAKTDPPLLSVLAGPIAWMKGVYHINWLQDLYPEVATAIGIGRSKTQSWAIFLLRWLRDLTLRHADANVVLGERMAKLVKERNVAAQRITIIANWADGSQILPVERKRNILRKEWGLTDAFVVGYSGNLGRAHSFDTFLTAIAVLEEQKKAALKAHLSAAADDWQDDPDKTVYSDRALRWLFIGGGAQMEQLKREGHARGHNSVMFQPYQPRELLAASLSAPDVHLISLRPGLEGLIVPSKYYGIAAAGRPAIFVGDPEGELASIIRRSGTGFVIREDDGTGLAEAILALARNPALVAAQGARARQLFETEYDLPHAVAAWETLLQKVSH